MNNIAIIPNTDKDPSLEYTRETAEEILKYGKTVLLSEKLKAVSKALDTAKIKFLPYEKIFENADLLVALGGDGTILNTAKDAAFHGVPVMGINIGHLGFLSQAEKDGKAVFKEVFSGNYTISQSMLLKVCIYGENEKSGEKEEKESFLAFNDAVIRGADSKMVTLKISVDGTVMSEYTADGVVCSTPTGSTAYSMSAGGPVLHPSLKCMLVTPVCPHSLGVRSTVLPAESTVKAEAVPPYRCDAVLSVDGKKVRVLEKNESVIITSSEQHTKLLKLPNKNFFDIIREKLNFS